MLLIWGSTSVTSFLHQEETTQNAKWEETNCQNDTKCSKTIRYMANPTCSTTTNSDDLLLRLCNNYYIWRLMMLWRRAVSLLWRRGITLLWRRSIALLWWRGISLLWSKSWLRGITLLLVGFVAINKTNNFWQLYRSKNANIAFVNNIEI